MPATPAHTTRHPLPAPAGDWAALQAQLYSTWHHITHAKAGLARVAHAQLCLPTFWRAAADGTARQPLQQWAQHLAACGTKVEVVLVAGADGADLRLRWVAWHAPPMASSLASDPPDPPDPTTPLPPVPEELTMKFPFFTKSTLATGTTDAVEPQLTPQAVAPARRSGAQLPLALSQVAEHIARQEVQPLLELGMNGRYRLFTLTFWVSAANQPALRNLMEINQRDPRAGKQVLDAAFAKSHSVALLDTTRLALVFTPGDALPRDAAEVLIVCGRDTVTLPYSYQGEIELPTIDATRTPAASASQAAQAAPADAAATAPLCLWLQTAQQPLPQRWLVRGPTLVGADSSCDVPVEWSRVSGQHLRLMPGPQGGWQVQDDSRNGTLCLDAEQAPTPGNPPERPLPKGQACPLPRAGSLRLGGGPQDPLLHFAQLAPSAPLQPAVASPAGPTRRVTELGPAVAAHMPTPPAGPRGTGV